MTVHAVVLYHKSLQCFRCTRFEHISKNCDLSGEVCRRCASPAHFSKYCSKPERCMSCCGMPGSRPYPESLVQIDHFVKLSHSQLRAHSAARIRRQCSSRFPWRHVVRWRRQQLSSCLAANLFSLVSFRGFICCWYSYRCSFEVSGAIARRRGSHGHDY